MVDAGDLKSSIPCGFFFAFIFRNQSAFDIQLKKSFILYVQMRMNYLEYGLTGDIV